MTGDEGPRILLVDDDETIRAGLGAFLERSGYRVVVAADGREALDLLADTDIALAVCDVIMPRVDGRAFVRRVRSDGRWLPIVLLTEVGESYERSAALDEGADDYLNKPFDPQELLSRVRAVLRRTVPGERPLSASWRVRAGELELDRTTRRVRLGGVELSLTPKAVMLLDYLMTHPGEVHTRDRLLSALWGFEVATSTRAVDHRVAELRRVLDDDAGAPRFVETVPNVGYRFVHEVVTP